MGLAFDYIYPVVYPVALELFKGGMERHDVAGEIFYQFGKRYHVPESKLSTEMIDLSITCAESDFKNSSGESVTARQVVNKWERRLIGLD